MLKTPKVVHQVRYPWDDWFSKRELVLLQGKHYFCKTSGFIIQMRNAAKSRNKRVSVEVKKSKNDDQSDSITVRVLKA